MTPASRRRPAIVSAPWHYRHIRRTIARRTAASLALGVLLSTLVSGSATPHSADRPETYAVPATGAVQYPKPTVTHLHYRHWQLDMKHPHGLVMSDVQLWWNIDGTALIQRCDVVEDPKSTRISQPLTVRGPCADTWHLTAGMYRPRMPHPLPDSIAALRTWLTEIGDGNSDHATIAAIMAMLREHHLNQQQQAAVLTILADMPGIKYRGTTTDRAGRTGMAFSLDSTLTDGSTITDLLIVDPDDGSILGYDKVLTTPAPGSRLDPITVIETLVIVESAMTSVIPGHRSDVVHPAVMHRRQLTLVGHNRTIIDANQC
ncbi:hypothetical protein HDA40_002075 [Hamadaea flava]|uniref:Uncharacterized protein n=1 Tax=Hamadaea flava TaxID=1742688 RepID=A0ABV8LLF4_9ACTN|nr:hypothetical protein [Hamadaea flava]MCP2323568.1 hypothetical protein [Hamadaea flava]